MAFLIRQASISMAWPIDSTFISESCRPSARSGVFGTRSSAWNLGFAFASFAAGRIIVQSGYDWLFASIVLFSTLVGAALLLLFPTSSHGASAARFHRLFRGENDFWSRKPLHVLAEGMAESDGKAATSA